MNTKVIKSANIALRLLIMGLTVWFVYDRLFRDQDFSSITGILEELNKSGQTTLMMAAMLSLMLLNHLLEAFKWKLLIDRLEKVSLMKAFSAVLSGVSVSMFLPNRSGDYLGRVFILDHTNPLKAILVTMIGSFAQLLTTIMAGLVALVFFLPVVFSEVFSLNEWMFGLTVFAAGSVMIFSVVAYLNLGFFGSLPAYWFGKRFQKISDYTAVFSSYSRLGLLRILVISAARYLVFSLQFYLLLVFTGLETDYFTAMMLVAITYLMLAFIPSLAITELGIRGSVSVWLFGLYFENSADWGIEGMMSVIATSALLWMINLALPALLGAIFVFRLKFIRKGNGS
jgi:hypothetical protein